MYTSSDLDQLRVLYRDGLLSDTLPFWLKHSIDREAGGFLFCVGQNGECLSTDKPVWLHGRFVWLMATLYVEVEKKPEWLELARHGLDFMERHAFDEDGRMFYSLTREGKPLRKRRYLFTESFGVVAYAAYARATGDQQAADRALSLFKLMLYYHQTPGLLEPKGFPETRQTKGLAMPMILIVTAQELQKVVADPLLDTVIHDSIEEITTDFLKPEFQAVLESVGPNGDFLDNMEGRLICPGHSIEAAWFILQEAKKRNNDPALRKIGLQILDWSWAWGWDESYGGIMYYRDAKNLPSTEYWHDMKFWWPQNEAIIATLLAYHLSGDEKYARWHQMAHKWAYTHFPDSVHGEWFGYLHRDGRLSTPVKGNMWKGPFHLPRMQLYGWKLIEEMMS